MRKIRDVLRLTHALGMSRRLAGEATGIGKTAVGEYVRRAAVAGLSWPILDEIDDAELERRLFPPTDAASSAAPADGIRRSRLHHPCAEGRRADEVVNHGCHRRAPRTTPYPLAETTAVPARHHRSRPGSAS